MKFYLDIWNQKYNQPTKYPCILIENNGWDDHGYKTLFQLYYCATSYNQKEFLGEVKVLSKKSPTTYDVMPKNFNELDDDFCSLGQSIDYYRKINELSPDIRDFIYKGLNDVVFSDYHYNLFKDDYGFDTSLMRTSESIRIVKNRSELATNIDFTGNDVFSFTFTSKLEGADEAHIIDVNFQKHSQIPNRINAIIGKNGTGKTAVLSNMAKSLVMGDKGCFSNFPSYSKIIAVSYSAFDEFYKPKEDINNNFENSDSIDNTIKNSNSFFNYIYCGLRDKDKILSIKDLQDKLKLSLEEIRKRKWINEWKEILGELFENNQEDILNNILNNQTMNLSSGQSILVAIFTEVIANIEKESLIIFDEPEIHLHPNAMSNLMRMISKLLEQYNSYCIISTHSPMIIQEIPSTYVRVFERYGNTPSIKKLQLECFGESINNIINDVFRVSSQESNYKTILDDLCSKYSVDDIMTFFNNKLSLNAVTYLRTLEHLKE